MLIFMRVSKVCFVPFLPLGLPFSFMLIFFLCSFVSFLPLFAKDIFSFVSFVWCAPNLK